MPDRNLGRLFSANFRAGPFQVEEDFYKRLRLHEPSRNELVGACIYLGYGPIQIEELMGSSLRDSELRAILAEAKDLGFNKTTDGVVIAVSSAQRRRPSHG